MHNGNLFCALDALERWLTQRLDAGEGHHRLYRKGFFGETPAALISVLLNVAKYRPSLLAGPRGPYYVRTCSIGTAFAMMGLASNSLDGVGSRAARRCSTSPVVDSGLHRKRKFLDVVVGLLLTDGELRGVFKLLPTWTLP